MQHIFLWLLSLQSENVFSLNNEMKRFDVRGSSSCFDAKKVVAKIVSWPRLRHVVCKWLLHSASRQGKESSTA